MISENAHFRMHRDLGVKHVSATYIDHRFPPHWHDEFLFGLTVAGSEQFIQNGKRHISRAGQVRVINPGEVHEGGSGPDGFWSYEAIYVPDCLMREATLSAGGSRIKTRLSKAVIDNPVLAKALTDLLNILQSNLTPLARQESFALFLKTLVELTNWTSNGEADEEPCAIRRAREFVTAHVGQPITLDTLAEISGLSKFHLLRVFKAQTGLTPWQFQMQARIEQVRKMLAAGEPAGQVAAACGFVDQSHMTRRFRQFVGSTPTSYANNLRADV